MKLLCSVYFRIAYINIIVPSHIEFLVTINKLF